MECFSSWIPNSLFYKITKEISDVFIPFPNPHYDSMKTKQKTFNTPFPIIKICRDIQGIIWNQDSKGGIFSVAGATWGWDWSLGWWLGRLGTTLNADLRPEVPPWKPFSQSLTAKRHTWSQSSTERLYLHTTFQIRMSRLPFSSMKVQACSSCFQ